MIAFNLDQICDLNQDPDHNMRSNLGLGVSNERSELPLTATTYTATFGHTFISNFFQNSVPNLMIAFNLDLCDLDQDPDPIF